MTGEAWPCVRPYLPLSGEESGSRRRPLRAAFAAYRSLLRSGCGWRIVPSDLPPWTAVHVLAARWHADGVFGMLIADLRGTICLGEGRGWSPSGAVLDSRTLKSSPSSTEAAYDGAKRVKGRKLHLAADALGYRLAAVVSPADARDRAVVAQLCAEMQADAARHGGELVVVKHAGPRPASCCCPGGGRWSARSRGKPTPAGSPRLRAARPDAPGPARQRPRSHAARPGDARPAPRQRPEP